MKLSYKIQRVDNKISTDNSQVIFIPVHYYYFGLHLIQLYTFPYDKSNFYCSLCLFVCLFVCLEMDSFYYFRALMYFIIMQEKEKGCSLSLLESEILSESDCLFSHLNVICKSVGILRFPSIVVIPGVEEYASPQWGTNHPQETLASSRYNIMLLNLLVICGRSVVFSGFILQ